MKTKKIISLALATVTLCATLIACGNKTTPESTTSTPNSSVSSTSGASAIPATEEKITIGRLERNSIEAETRDHINMHQTAPKRWEFKDFPSLNAMLLEMQAGRIDAFVTSSSVANYLASKDDNLLTIKEMRDVHFHMATQAEDTALTEELSSAIDALKADGTMDKLVADYLTNATGDPTVNKLASNPDGETHIVAITGDLPPMDFVAADGTPAGFNVALLNTIAEKKGCNFEIVQMDAAARLSALESGKIDLIFWIDCQGDADFEPKPEGVSLTTPYFEESFSFVTNSPVVMEILKATI